MVDPHVPPLALAFALLTAGAEDAAAAATTVDPPLRLTAIATDATTDAFAEHDGEATHVTGAFEHLVDEPTVQSMRSFVAPAFGTGSVVLTAEIVPTGTSWTLSLAAEIRAEWYGPGEGSVDAAQAIAFTVDVTRPVVVPFALVARADESGIPLPVSSPFADAANDGVLLPGRYVLPFEDVLGVSSSGACCSLVTYDVTVVVIEQPLVSIRPPADGSFGGSSHGTLLGPDGTVVASFDAGVASAVTTDALSVATQAGADWATTALARTVTVVPAAGDAVAVVTEVTGHRTTQAPDGTTATTTSDIAASGVDLVLLAPMDVETITTGDAIDPLLPATVALDAGPVPLDFADSIGGPDAPDGESVDGTVVHVLRPRLPRTADLDGDGRVDFDDLLLQLSAWGTCGAPFVGCPGDLDFDGDVDFVDTLAMLAEYD